MLKGKVKFFNESKGFGFITNHADGKDIFVHVTGLNDKIEQDDEVEFTIVDGKKGPSAADVRKV